jgi:rod shape-determining protein MreD
MLLIAFVLATAALLLQGILIPHLSLLAFAPFLSLAIMRANSPLWLGALAGALVDLFSDDPMGLHALNYTFITALLYRYRRHFLFDQPLHLCLLTALISLLSTLTQLFLLFLFDRRIPFDGKWIFGDLVAMPAMDALYAFVWFAAPLAFCNFIRQLWVRYWLKRKNPSPISH